MSGKTIIILILCACSVYYIAENYDSLSWFKSIESPEEVIKLDNNTLKATPIPTPESMEVSSKTRVGRAEFLYVNARVLDSFYDFEKNRKIEPSSGHQFVFVEATMKNSADNDTVFIASDRLAVTDRNDKVYPCKSLLCSDRIKKIGDTWLLGRKDVTGMDMIFEVPKKEENFELHWVAEYKPPSVVETPPVKKESQRETRSERSRSTTTSTSRNYRNNYNSRSDSYTRSSSNSYDNSWNNEFLDRADEWGGIDSEKTWSENMRDVAMVYTGDEDSDMVSDYEMIGAGMDVVDLAFGISDSFSDTS